MLFALISAFIVAVDQFLKLNFTKLLLPGESIPVIKDIFYVTLVRNKGAAFGIFKSQISAFIILSIIAIFLIAYYFPRLNKKAILAKLGLALILGGAASNLIDRIRFGYVIDFLDFRIWPVFNIADSALTVGAILVIAQLVRKK